MIEFLIFYWIFSSLFTLGALLDDKRMSILLKMILSLIVGWYAFPMMLGNVLQQISDRK